MADAQVWQTPDAESAIGLAAELLRRGYGPVDTVCDDLLGNLVVVPDDSPRRSDAVAFLEVQEGLVGPRWWLSPTHPGYVRWVLGNRDWAAAKAWICDYRGLSLDDATRRAEADDRPYRVIAPGDAVTLDARSSRLNLHLDTDGNLIEMSAG